MVNISNFAAYTYLMISHSSILSFLAQVVERGNNIFDLFKIRGFLQFHDYNWRVFCCCKINSSLTKNNIEASPRI